MDLAIVQNFGLALIPSWVVIQFVGPVRQGRDAGAFRFVEAEHVPPPVGRTRSKQTLTKVTGVTDVGAN